MMLTKRAGVIYNGFMLVLFVVFERSFSNGSREKKRQEKQGFERGLLTVKTML